MSFFLKIGLFFIDIFNKIKIISFLKKKFKNEKIVIIDVGAHTGETVDLFYNNFLIKKIICYEASKINFIKLSKKIKKNKKFDGIIELNNIGLGKEISKLTFHQTIESSSSTFCKINYQSEYYKRKKKILNLFLDGNYVNNSEEVLIVPLKDEFKKYDLDKIDILKIDTEGYELNVLKGLDNKINLVKYIYFEHHYDNMILKNYTFQTINSYLVKCGFKKSFKLKMPLRKTFEYIYENKDFHC